MTLRSITVRITSVGPSADPLAMQVAGRGVFNLSSVLDYLAQPVGIDVDEIIIDLSCVGWVSLFDWWCFTSILHGTLKENPDLKISLDFLGDRLGELIPYRECADYIKGKLQIPKYTKHEYVNSLLVHRVLGFIKALEGPEGFRHVAGGRIALRWVSEEYAGRSGWYRRDSEIEDSVFLPRASVAAKEMCVLFASRKQIDEWRIGMVAKRVPKAAVFHSEEFWRILCHELARNVVEHAKGPGFITARVVLPVHGQIPRWCNDVYDKAVVDRLRLTQQSGFLELCVCDAGQSIPLTIEEAYYKRYRERHLPTMPLSAPQDVDLLQFAFDELGTCKDAEHSWLTDRHALGQILLVVGKYGGILSIRSRGAALIYSPTDVTFRRCTNQLGYEAQETRAINPAIPGTHIQMLIPLVPLAGDRADKPNSVLARYLPTAFHIDDRHPVGPLVPIRDRLGAFALGVEGDDLVKFKAACRALACSLLQGAHPRDEVLAFDFGEVDWSPPQFETFLYLLQNVLVGRPVLFTNVSRKFAELVNAQEDAEIPTYLVAEMREEIEKRALEREFTEGKFLETFSSLGSIVLALGPDEGEFLFGVRGDSLRKALLEVVNGKSQTAEVLAESYGLELDTVNNVLNGSACLFSHQPDGRWESVWSSKSLASQRLRSITDHFDRVSVSCSAWRGKRTGRSASAAQGDRFYLPTEDAVYSEFFETSRILARERYVTEVAERMIYRMSLGLATLDNPTLTFDDVDILACSSTPSVMLAEAIRRAWPVGIREKRPDIIDYGPSLFFGADPARISFASGDARPRAVVVHDLFDEGRLSAQLVKLADEQGIEVLFVLSFVRFVDMGDRGAKHSTPFPPSAEWGVNPIVGKPVHAMIGLRRPHKSPRRGVTDWGVGDDRRDYVVDPRSLRPVSLRSLRLESGYSAARSLTKRDACLKELDGNSDDPDCRLAAGHFVYGQRHYAVVVDVRGVLAGAIGHRITNWLADICCNQADRIAPWEDKREPALLGEVSDLLLPLHSQIHYILPHLQAELAQRGKRIPHFFLDYTSFGGGVVAYDIPAQLRHQIVRAADEIKKIMQSSRSQEQKVKDCGSEQLRILLVDDAIFSGRTLQTVLDSLGQHCRAIMRDSYGGQVDFPHPIHWIRAFAVLNQLPPAKSALWHQLNSSSACSLFRFDEYAPFVGVATFSAADCPACRERDQLEHIAHRLEAVGATSALNWIKTRRNELAPHAIEAPYFRKEPSPVLPEPIDVLALPGGGAPDRHKPRHADSAIWRFYELMYLSYPLSDVLKCLPATRIAGLKFPSARIEYARFRLAVYDWCMQNWHQVRLYQAEEQLLGEIRAEVIGEEKIFAEATYRLCTVLPDVAVTSFIKWVIDFLAEKDADPRLMVSEATLGLDTALTLLFLALRRTDIETTGLLQHLSEKQATMPRKTSFLSILHLRLTRPLQVADPCWALTTIAETCFRGHVGNTPEERRTTDHELLGRLVADTARMPDDNELRRRLEGSLYAFIAAAENLQPYFDTDLLTSVVGPARKALDWLGIPVPDALEDTTPVMELNQSMQDRTSWRKFARACHMSACEFAEELKGRLATLRKTAGENPYNSVDLEVEVSPEVQEWCLMTHIPRLIAFLSNIALEPVKTAAPSGPSRVIFKPCQPGRPHALIIKVTTHYGPAEDARGKISKSSKIARSKDDLGRFGVTVLEAPAASDGHDSGFHMSLVVPVGFQPSRR